MKINTYSKGFTLIELLVVIAIIGLLASVILASLGTSKIKSQDANIKQQLVAARSQAELFYSVNTVAPGTYTSVCTTGTVGGATAIGAQVQAASNVAGAGTVLIAGAAQGATASYCFVNTTAPAGIAWMAMVPLRTLNTFSSSSGQDYWCVDSANKSKVVDLPAVASATACL